MLVNDILLLSKMQSNTLKMNKEIFDITELIKTILKRFVIYENDGYTFTFKETKTFKIEADKKDLIVLPEVDSKIIKSANNIPGVKTAQVNELNVYDILNADKLIIVKDALAKIEEVYA